MDIRVAAVMTAPRYECVAARSQIERSLSQAGVPLTISGGVFYGQCMQSMLEGLIGKVDYVLTVDFDSMFLPQHVLRLLSIVKRTKEIDALAAMQPMRGSGLPMGSSQGDTTLTRNPLKVETAHFGLTVIDAEKLAALPKPWFHSQPDSDGGWGDGRVDSDVWFWRAWGKAGNSCYVDPGCRLGHLEEVVTVFDERMRPQHLYPGRWGVIAETTVDK